MSCADCTRNKIFGQTTWQLRGSFRVQTARAHGVVCRLHAHGVLCRLHAEQDFLGRLRGIDVAAFVCRRCTRTVSCADCTRNKIWGRLRGIDVALTWQLPFTNVVQLQASTRLKTVSHESTPSYSQEVTRFTPCKLHKILLPGGYFPIPRRGFPVLATSPLGGTPCEPLAGKMQQYHRLRLRRRTVAAPGVPTTMSQELR